MSRKLSIVALLFATLGFISPAAVATAAPAHHAAASRASCTHTSSGSCIRGGEFCKQSLYNHTGYSATGKKYICKGSHTHPHWMLP